MPVSRFMRVDLLGAFFWVATFASLGYIVSGQIEQIAAYSLRWGHWLVVVLAGSLAVYVLWKYIRRQRFDISVQHIC
ncbi:MAG: DedA family protein [Candidatus Binatia bacterium]